MAVEQAVGFARRYRPKTLNQYIGNTDLKDSLKRYLKSKRPNTILLTGTTGCGKTTVARLITKEYFCMNWSEETGACNECEMCQYVNEYIETGDTDQLPDVIEVDIGTQGKVDNLKDLIETMQIPPSMAAWKVYIFDEFHLASNQAQSSLLKIIEEPPENVLIIFCTTDPQMMLSTIKNRCQLKLNVQKPTLSELTNHLKKICLQEGKEYDMEGLRIIASRSDFVIRDALNNLERVIETRGDATSPNVSKEFKAIGDKLIFKFFEAYRNTDIITFTSLLYTIRKEYDFGQFLSTLENFTVKGIYIVNGIQDLDGLSQEEWDDYSRLFSKFSQQEICTILNELNSLNKSRDIESNLMAFIYKKYELEHKPSTSSKKSDFVSVSEKEQKEEEITFEAKIRNKTLVSKDNAKVENGRKILQDEAKELSMEDVMSEGFFFGERVDN